MAEYPNNEEAADQEGGLAFRLIFRLVVGIGILLCGAWAFSGKVETLYRVAFGVSALAGAFMFYAVGRPGRLYGMAIGMFCSILGGFGSVICFLDESCVPRERALWMIAATATFACAVWAVNSYPAGSAVRILSQAIGIVSATAALYLAWYSRAFGGALVFLLIALGAFVAALTPEKQPPEPQGSGESSAPSRSGQPLAATAGASAMFWFAYMARDDGGWIVLAFGSLWLIGALAHAWKTRKSPQKTENAH